jgi:carbamoyltransferase
LNSAFTGKVLPETDFKDVFIQPAAGDAGTALGVCDYIWHQVLGKPGGFMMNDAYTGPQFRNGAIQKVHDHVGLSYQMLDDDVLVMQAAAIVASSDVLVGFRDEWNGDRACWATISRYIRRRSR